MLLRLGGVGLEWLPSIGALAASLILVHGLAFLVPPPGVPLSRRVGHWWDVVSTHRFGVGLACLAAVGVLYRVFDIGYDLGQAPVPFDERRLANSVRLFLRSGEINHETVEHYPGVHYWLLVGVYLLTYLRALTNGLVETFASVPLETFVVAGRFTSSILAVGTIILTGLLGRLVSDERTGLLAAGVMTFSPLAERVSTSLRNDETTVLLTLAAATAAIGYYRSARPGWSVVAGALAGAAAAVKYSAVFSLSPALVARRASRDGDSVARENRTAQACAPCSDHFKLDSSASRAPL